MMEKIESLHDAGTARHTAALWDGLRLPVPDAGEYAMSWDNGIIVFLNREACVIRLTAREDLPGIEDPGLLQPIASFEAGALRLDINPGLECPVSRNDAELLYDQLETRGVRLWDAKPYNCGYLPAENGHGGSRRFPVVVDPCAVMRLHASATAVQHFILAKTRLFNAFGSAGLPGPVDTDPPPPDLQERLFSPLRKAFDAARKADGAPDAARIAPFWDTCAMAARDGFLKASWLSADMERSGYKNAFASSRNFERRLAP